MIETTEYLYFWLNYWDKNNNFERIRRGFITYEFQVVNYGLRVSILRKWICKLRVLFYELESNFISCEFIFRVGNTITSCKLAFASFL